MTTPFLPTRIQGVVTNFASVASINQAITVATTGNTLIVVVINRGVTSGYAASAVSGGGANVTWYRLGSGVNGTAGPGAVDIWAGINATAGAQTVTITINGTNVAGCQVDEWQYLDNAAMINDYVQAVSATGNSTSPSSSPPQGDLNEVIYVGTSSANTQTASPGSPWSTLTGPTSSGNQVAGVAYMVANLEAAQTATWAQTSGQWTTVSVQLRGQNPDGYKIPNDPAAATNAAVLAQQAAPDFLDSVITALALRGTGVLAGMSVGPNNGSDFNYVADTGVVTYEGALLGVGGTGANAIPTADATNPRKDLVWVDVDGVVQYTAGAPAAVPCLPTPPAFPFVALAEIDVPAGATVFDNGTSPGHAHVTDKRAIVRPTQLSVSDIYRAPAALTSGGPSIGSVAAETIPRSLCSIDSGSVNSGKMACHGIYLPRGFRLGRIGINTATNAAVGQQHWWFALLDYNLNGLAVTADQLTTGLAAATYKQLAIATTAEGARTSYRTPYSGLYYIGILFVCNTTVPTLIGISVAASPFIGPPPTPAFTSNESFTTPPAFPWKVTASGQVYPPSYANASSP